MIAIKRDKTTICVGDDVETSYHPKAVGIVLTVSEIVEDPNCESGFMVKAHVKDHPAKTLKTKTEDRLDVNWFNKINQ